MLFKRTMTKFKVLLPSLLLSSLATPIFAHTMLDSIGIENQDGKKVILHKVDPKENFYSIGRKYSVSPKAIMAFNNNITALSIGQVVKVPTERSFLESKPVVSQAIIPNKSAVQKPVATATSPVVTNNQSTDPGQPAPTQYKVSAGETLYAISKRFGVTLADIISINNLKSNSLTPGQILLIKATPPQAAATTQQPVQQVVVTQQPPTPVTKRDTTRVAASVQDSMTINTHNPANRYGLLEKNENGLAVWMDNDNLDASKKYVLHRTAPVGTVIKITNPMTNRTTFAKVVGRFTETEKTKDAMLVMTKSVAESLGAMDKRFHVTISYGTPNE
jgi:LysM repeat protein